MRADRVPSLRNVAPVPLRRPPGTSGGSTRRTRGPGTDRNGRVREKGAGPLRHLVAWAVVVAAVAAVVGGMLLPHGLLLALGLILAGSLSLVVAPSEGRRGRPRAS
ncbi:hypothetical protein [Streptomyces sp. NPDC005805]|uniref:hypothetical protein n=1 Tax=Streptomyces sp. NPDC005805 TaxID=3157068 RepID=UPI0033D04D19